MPFLFLSIEHSAFKVLILLRVSLSNAAPAIEPLLSFEVFNLVALIEEMCFKIYMLRFSTILSISIKSRISVLIYTGHCPMSALII